MIYYIKNKHFIILPKFWGLMVVIEICLFIYFLIIFKFSFLCINKIYFNKNSELLPIKEKLEERLTKRLENLNSLYIIDKIQDNCISLFSIYGH